MSNRLNTPCYHNKFSRWAQHCSRLKLWILFITGFLHLHYSAWSHLHCWKVALSRPLSPGRDEKGEGVPGTDNSCTVSKTDVRISILAISFRVLVYRHAQQICEAVIAMHYPESAVKGRITNCSQWPIITAGPEEHRRVKLAQRHHQRERRRRENNTKQVKFTILIFRCLLLLSICLIR